AATARQPWRPTSGSVGRCSDGGDGMLVDEDFLAFALEHHGETVEALEAPQQVPAGHQLEVHGLPFLEALEEIPVLNIDVVLSHTPSRDPCAWHVQVLPESAIQDPGRKTRSPPAPSETRSPAAWRNAASPSRCQPPPSPETPPPPDGGPTDDTRSPGK